VVEITLFLGRALPSSTTGEQQGKKDDPPLRPMSKGKEDPLGPLSALSRTTLRHLRSAQNDEVRFHPSHGLSLTGNAFAIPRLKSVCRIVKSRC